MDDDRKKNSKEDSIAIFFPYENIRREQDEIIRHLCSTLGEERCYVFEAPSGVGKTVAVLSVLLPFALDKGLRIFYMCRTHTQMGRVIEELRAMHRSGYKVDGVMLRGKSEMCRIDYVRKLPYRMMVRACEKLRASHKCPFDMRFRELLAEGALDGLYGGIYHSDDIMTISRGLRICPYELGIELARRATVITLSYVYLVDRELRNIILNALNVYLDEAVVVIDEAHNVLDVAMEAESMSISTKNIEDAISCLQRIKLGRTKSEQAWRLTRTKYLLVKCLRVIKQILEDRGDRERTYSPQEFTNDFEQRVKESILIFMEHLSEFMKTVARGRRHVGLNMISLEMVRDFLHKLIETWNDARYIHVLVPTKGGMDYAIICIDPSVALAPILRESNVTVHMSATLSPLEDYMEIVGIKKAKTFKVKPSYHGRVKAVIITGVTTAYEMRHEDMYRRIAQLVGRVADSLDANIAVFTPSYDVLNSVRAFLGVTKRIFVEERGESTASLEEKIREFRSMYEVGGGVLMGVLGGRTCEGVDYPGRELEVVIIVGVPYPEPSAKLFAQRRFYAMKYGDERGFRYTAVVPAMRKVNQAIGRLVRSPNDYGLVVLMDDRYVRLMDYIADWVKIENIYRYDEVDRIIEYLRASLSRFRRS